MLTYLQVHLYFLLPPIAILGALYNPIFGRREALKILWLVFMATLSATPWDNFILYYSGWTYPPHAVLGRIALIPIEEHLFFILQPLFVLLLHFVITHPRLLPFDLPPLDSRPQSSSKEQKVEVTSSGGGHSKQSPQSMKKGEGEGQASEEQLRTIQTLPRHRAVAVLWSSLFFLGLSFVLEAHGVISILGLGKHAFYLGWILVWIIPVITFLTYLGGRLTRPDSVALALSVGWLWMIDTVAIRSGTWSITAESSLGWHVWRGLPFEEFVFFYLTSYLLILASSLMAHLHTLLLLSPELPPCPPRSPLKHIHLLAQVAYHPPEIDSGFLKGLQQAERTLRKGSKSFEVAKLAFGREMRLGLVVVYAWCRVTDNLIDEPVLSSATVHSNAELSSIRRTILNTIRRHLVECYNLTKQYPAQIYPSSTLNTILDDIPNLSISDRSAFHLFSAIIPRLVPIYPFLELCDGYETDMKFASFPLRPQCLEKDGYDIDNHLPIRTNDDLMRYADNVAGSIAAAICYLSWSVLTEAQSARTKTRPVDQYTFAERLHNSSPNTKSDKVGQSELSAATNADPIRTIACAREMGRALQLVNIARDIAKDALQSRLYVPLSSFPSGQSLLSILFPSPCPSPTDRELEQYAKFTLPLLDKADKMRTASEGAVRDLPRTARGGARAMAASYFEIAQAIRDRRGEVDERGVRVSKWSRARKALGAMWLCV